MVSQSLEICGQAILACVDWLERLFSAVGGTQYLIAALLILFVTSLFLIPLRGAYTGGAIRDYKTSQFRKQQSKNRSKNQSKKGS